MKVAAVRRAGTDIVVVVSAMGGSTDRLVDLAKGVCTDPDPRMVPQARRLERVTFDEMLELAGQGSRVLHLRSVEFSSKYNVPLRVASSFVPGPGTVICREESRVEAPVVSGIAFNRDEAEITVAAMPDVPGTTRLPSCPLWGVGMRSHAGVATLLFETLARESINVRMVSTSEIKISVLAPEQALELGVKSLHAAFGLEHTARC